MQFSHISAHELFLMSLNLVTVVVYSMDLIICQYNSLALTNTVIILICYKPEDEQFEADKEQVIKEISAL